MRSTLLGTASVPYVKLFSADQSGSSITIPTPTMTAPSGDGIIDATSIDGRQDFSSILLKFFGVRTSADNETFTARVTGWRRFGQTGLNDLWIPTPLLSLALTQGTSIGVASTPAIATNYFADTIVVSTAFTNAYEVISPADNSIALIKLDIFGSQLVQVQLAKGTNAACNGAAATF